jgi:hypothetical protein
VYAYLLSIDVTTTQGKREKESPKLEKKIFLISLFANWCPFFTPKKPREVAKAGESFPSSRDSTERKTKKKIGDKKCQVSDSTMKKVNFFWFFHLHFDVHF